MPKGTVGPIQVSEVSKVCMPQGTLGPLNIRALFKAVCLKEHVVQSSYKAPNYLFNIKNILKELVIHLSY